MQVDQALRLGCQRPQDGKVLCYGKECTVEEVCDQHDEYQPVLSTATQATGRTRTLSYAAMNNRDELQCNACSHSAIAIGFNRRLSDYC